MFRNRSERLRLKAYPTLKGLRLDVMFFKKIPDIRSEDLPDFKGLRQLLDDVIGPLRDGV